MTTNNDKHIVSYEIVWISQLFFRVTFLLLEFIEIALVTFVDIVLLTLLDTISVTFIF